jgi:hypothetical protein
MAGMTYSGRSWTQPTTLGRVLSGIVAVLGIWQISAPFILNFAVEQMVMWNTVLCGFLLVLFAGLSLYGIGRWERTSVSSFNFLAAVVGLWLLVSPFALGYQANTTAFWNAIIIGAISGILAVIAGIQSRHVEA